MANQRWFTVGQLTEAHDLRVEEVRIVAEGILSPDCYDPELDMVSEAGRHRLVDYLAGE